MDGIEDLNELNEYLSLPIEQVSNPIAWWWEHRKTYPCLSVMAFGNWSQKDLVHMPDLVEVVGDKKSKKWVWEEDSSVEA